MDSTKTDLIAKITAANTVLVTVSRNPSIDQLAACIGLALLVSKLKKHGTAIFSGEVPSTIEFLKPEETLEKNTDSLRDFIIALDKSKADKLRYKVEDQVVKIFITPYRTSLNEDDLEFSQGDLNVDLVVTLGVEKSEDLDQAIVANGNILHDATIVSINNVAESALGSINWNVPQASSLCELIAELSSSLGEKLVDAQIATALLTGVVAETARFSNDKTTSLTMSIASELMAAGANQQLVATELSESGQELVTKKDNSELDINHQAKPDELNAENTTLPTPTEEGANQTTEEPRLVSEPPQLGGTLTANSSPQSEEPSTDPLSNPGAQSQNGFTPPPPSWVPPFADKEMENKVEANLTNPTSTISNLEESVDSPHLHQERGVTEARENVVNALDQPETPVVPEAPVVAVTPVAPVEASKAPPHDDLLDSASFKFPDDLDPKDLKPPTDPKAPPYPPPIVSPPSESSTNTPQT